MRKSKNMLVTIRTREKNEDNHKIEILAGSYKLSETEILKVPTEKGFVLIKFEIRKKLLNKFMDDLTFLNIVGVYGERI